MSKYDYAVYKGDRFIDLGSREYLSQLLNVTPKYISFLASPTARKRRKKGEESNAMICVRLEREK